MPYLAETSLYVVLGVEESTVLGSGFVRVVPLLLKGVPYREIHDLTEVSVTTIGRVARTLESGTGGYAAALRRQQSRSTSASH